jgi:hypothetical protein
MLRKAIWLVAFVAGTQVAGIANAENTLKTPDFSPVQETRVATDMSVDALIRRFGANPDTVHADCIEEGQTCVLHGTPC